MPDMRLSVLIEKLQGLQSRLGGLDPSVIGWHDQPFSITRVDIQLDGTVMLEMSEKGGNE